MDGGVNVDCSRCSVFGHSMGGHGALMVALKNPGKYRSVSAFAPICNPSIIARGATSASGRYLGSVEAGKASTRRSCASSTLALPLMFSLTREPRMVFWRSSWPPTPSRRLPKGNPLVSARVRMQEGYDHSYYFISTFAGMYGVSCPEAFMKSKSPERRNRRRTSRVVNGDAGASEKR